MTYCVMDSPALAAAAAIADCWSAVTRQWITLSFSMAFFLWLFAMQHYSEL